MNIGSLIVHECCAEHISQKRRSHYIHSKKTNEQKLLDSMTSISRGKIFPIGEDSKGNHYWIFPGTRTLFVSLHSIIQNNRFYKNVPLCLYRKS